MTPLIPKSHYKFSLIEDNIDTYILETKIGMSDNTLQSRYSSDIRKQIELGNIIEDDMD